MNGLTATQFLTVELLPLPNISTHVLVYVPAVPKFLIVTPFTLVKPAVAMPDKFLWSASNSLISTAEYLVLVSEIIFVITLVLFYGNEDKLPNFL